MITLKPMSTKSLKKARDALIDARPVKLFGRSFLVVRVTADYVSGVGEVELRELIPLNKKGVS